MCKGTALRPGLDPRSAPGLIPRKGPGLAAPGPGLGSPGTRAVGPGKGISSNPRHRVGLRDPSPEPSLFALHGHKLDG